MPKKSQGGKSKRQAFHFPKAGQVIPDEELDSLIDGETRSGDESSTVDAAVTRTRKDSKKKIDAAKAAAEIPQIFTPEQCEWVFDIYTGILSFIFSVIFKSDFEIIFDAIKFDDDQKKALSKPLAKVASKYSPASWAANTAEIELMISVSMYSVMSFSRAKTAVQKDREKKLAEQRQQNRRNTVTQQNTAQRSVQATVTEIPV